MVAIDLVYRPPDWLTHMLERSREVNALIERLPRFPPIPNLDTAWIAPILRDFSIASEWARLFDAFAEEIRERGTSEFQSFDWEFGWLGFMPAAFMWAFYRKHKSGGWEAAWREVEAWFDTPEKVGQLKVRIAKAPLVQERMRIIECRLDAHAAGNFVASVCVLLPQVEGLIWDIGVKSGLVDASGPSSQVKLDKNGQIVKGRKGKPVVWGLHDLVSAIWDYPPFVIRFR